LPADPEVAGAAGDVAAGVGAGLAATDAAGAGVGAGIAAGFAAVAGAAAYHVCTPLCPPHAPLLLAAIEYVPSLQIPVAPAGAPAGACAIAEPAPSSTPASIHCVFVIDRSLVCNQFEKSETSPSYLKFFIIQHFSAITIASMAPTLAGRPITDWIGFHLALLALLATELVFSRWGLAALPPQARARRQHRDAILATILWVAAALLFAAWIFHAQGGAFATQFLAGYTIEESLSIDNLFVFLLLFRIFTIPPEFQPRVLFFGVLGAIVLRGTFIAGGIQLLTRFEWVSYVFALILLAASIRLLIPEKEEQSPTKTPVWIHWISRIHPVSPRHDVFFTRGEAKDGRPGIPMVTMLFLALLAIETADIVFALDSIPAVLSITREPFLAYTSNILAVIGLRALFFLLARMLRQLRFLHFGLAAILAFAALRMLTARWIEIGPLPALSAILAILAVTIALSLAFRRPQPAA
jgi:tellurite resistance protein TerC